MPDSDLNFRLSNKLAENSTGKCTYEEKRAKTIPSCIMLELGKPVKNQPWHLRFYGKKSQKCIVSLTSRELMKGKKGKTLERAVSDWHFKKVLPQNMFFSKQ